MGTEAASTLVAAVEGASAAVEAINTVMQQQHQLIARCSRLSRFHSAKTACFMHALISRRTELHCNGERSVKNAPTRARIGAPKS